MKIQPQTRAFTFVELLISAGLVAALLLTLSAIWLHAQQTIAQTQQVLMAEQILNNIMQELHAHHGSWDAPLLNHWQMQAQQYLLGAQLTVATHQLQITWPTQKSMAIHCEAKAQQGCIGMAW